jgi:hypothetical protein
MNEPMDARALELATLAARICPEVCQQESHRAIELAQALLEAAHAASNPNRDLDLLRRDAEKRDAELEPHRSFETGVKFITGEKRFDRAMPWFRKFIKTRSDSEKVCDEAIATARAKGFRTIQLDSLQAQFNQWKASDRSQTARTNRAKREAKREARKKRPSAKKKIH